MPRCLIRLALAAACLLNAPAQSTVATELRLDFDQDVRPLLVQYCARCHGGAEVNGGANLVAIKSVDDVANAFELWGNVVEHLKADTMPPEDEPQPTEDERQRVYAWYQSFLAAVETRPAVFRPRRLSVIEYRNTLRSVFGFDLEVAIIEAEQTVAERSLVVKLLPTDPPGKSGFKNDTHANPLTTVVWDQYSYLIDAAVEKLFSEPAHLVQLIHPHANDQPNLSEVVPTTIAQPLELGTAEAQSLLQTIALRASRRPVTNETLAGIHERLKGKQGNELVEAVKFEIKAALMSPQFVYRGLLMSGKAGQRQKVDDFELAERLSYFFWGDMPDEHLSSLAQAGSLTKPGEVAAEVDRLLASPKARYLSEVFATEWLTLREIEHVSNDVPKWIALQSQPTDFMHYLFTENRPLIELIDSKTAFISPHTARMYGRDASQMAKYVKQSGIEVEIVPNQKIRLDETVERGGILTMPGILAMNKGPILRGTWMLERILGEELPDPPANVGQVPPNRGGEHLSFRQRFEQHRSNSTCATCHDKIDPLGFAFESFDNQGQLIKSAKRPFSKKKKGGEPAAKGAAAIGDRPIDTSGRLPSGESFEDFSQLKQILKTTQKDAVIRNIVERTLAFALCRKLTIYDQPTLDTIVDDLKQSNGTWRDLFLAVVESVPFRETILSP